MIAFILSVAMASEIRSPKKDEIVYCDPVRFDDINGGIRVMGSEAFIQVWGDGDVIPMMDVKTVLPKGIKMDKSVYPRGHVSYGTCSVDPGVKFLHWLMPSSFESRWKCRWSLFIKPVKKCPVGTKAW